MWKEKGWSYLKTTFVLVRRYSVESPLPGPPKKAAVGLGGHELTGLVSAGHSLPRPPGRQVAHFPEVCGMPAAHQLSPGSSVFLLWNVGCVFRDRLRVEMGSCSQNHSLLSKAWVRWLSDPNPHRPSTSFPSSSISDLGLWQHFRHPPPPRMGTLGPTASSKTVFRMVIWGTRRILEHQ